MAEKLARLGYTYNGSGDYCIGPADDPQVDSVCTVWFPRRVSVQEGNDWLTLFAAAPQLLSALKAIRETYRGTEGLLGATVAAKIRAMDEAIAAAEGRS